VKIRLWLIVIDNIYIYIYIYIYIDSLILKFLTGSRESRLGPSGVTTRFQWSLGRFLASPGGVLTRGENAVTVSGY
jgi:hypothetical protein